MAGVRYTKQEDDILIHMRDDRNATWKEISEELGRTVNSVRRRYLHITEPGCVSEYNKRNYTKPNSKRSPSGIREYRKKRANDDPKTWQPYFHMRKSWTYEEDQILIEDWKAGITQEETARKLDRSVYSITNRRQFLKKARLIFLDQ